MYARVCGMAMVLGTVGFLATAAGAGAVAGTLAETAERVRSAKIREAALRSIDASVELLEERLSSPEEQALEILAKPERHHSRSVSRRLLQEQERAGLVGAFREQLAAFAQGREAELSGEWVDDVMDRERQRIDAVVDRLLQAEFPARYAQARERAVSMQRARLDEDIHPDAAEIEDLAGRPEGFAALRSEAIDGLLETPTGEALIAGYVVEVGSGHTLLEENDAVLHTRVRRAIHDGLTLLWRQLRLVKRAEPDGKLERSSIAAAIQAELTRLVEEAEQVSGTHYGVFPTAAAFAVERGRVLETREFVGFLGAQLDPGAGCPPLPAERVAREVPAAYEEAPAEFAAHERALVQALRSEVQERVLDAYVGTMEEGEARADFRRRLTDLVAADPEVRRTFEGGLAACIGQPLQERREALARRELEERAPGVADFSLEFGDPVLREIEADPHASMIALGIVMPAELHLEEARKAYQQHLDELRVEAEEAVWRQKGLTRSPEQKGRFVENIRADSERSEERKAYWQATYEASVLDAWRRARKNVLIADENGEPYHPAKYDRVFASVSEIIEEIITLEFVKLPVEVVSVEQGSPAQTTAAARTVVSAPPASTEQTEPGGDSGFSEGPAVGTQTKSGGGGPVARAERKAQAPGRQTGGGGAGGAEDCDTLLAQCSGASRVCYEALTRCKNDPSSCDAGIVRCNEERRRCTHAGQPVAPGPRDREASRRAPAFLLPDRGPFAFLRTPVVGGAIIAPRAAPSND